MITFEFYSLIKSIIKTKEFQNMKKYRHYIKQNVYNHSIKVAILCYNHYKRHNTKKIILKELVRGALLHDYYLYDWHEKNSDHKFHGFTHPKKAYLNAIKKYPDLSKKEADMIRRHMFPLTIIPPKTKAGWLVCLYDKLAAISDYFGKNKLKLN